MLKKSIFKSCNLPTIAFITMEVSYKSQKIIGIEKNLEDAVQSHCFNGFETCLCWKLSVYIYIGINSWIPVGK